MGEPSSSIYNAIMYSKGSPGPRVFFDSWGGAWAPCAPTDEGAEAFGPTGTARRVKVVGLPEGYPSEWAAARAAGMRVLSCPDGVGPDILA